MSMRMLVDAAHPEETRVVVTRGNKLEAFEFESASKKQLKGNIYLAKVTRVEPSLQAAFVDYGGNRHGFLAFNEIHPDYYQIPIEDRESLEESQPDDDDEVGETNGNTTDEGVESLAGEDELEEDIKRRSRAMRRYKIQEVIKRRQILLIQVVKEERGTKGAALTTYLSLAGRYCVLMPNTARGGGISRKIASPADRKRLKSIAGSLEVPEGMGVIIRTAGLNRTKPEIKRDYDYLLRMWNQVRELTLESSAPSLVHAEGDLIKRAIRDLYNKEISEILVAGDDCYRSAKDFMKTLMPSQAKVVQPYRESVPLFHKYQVEREIDEMYSPRVTLKSGAYLIINPTEALVAIDVNSGRATKERNIEETAYRTNLEAAEEVARQVRLRDLAGLVVIDFIDMEVSKNVRAVESKMKECLKSDRARIQVGRISSFGLMEMSRQRLRPDLVEASTNACPTCGGAGVVRSTESTALAVLRGIDEEGMRETGASLIIDAPTEVAIYILNQKRDILVELEQRYSFSVEVRIDSSLIAPDFRIERRNTGDGESGSQPVKTASPPTQPEASAQDGGDEERGSGRKRRRKRRRRPRRDGEEGANEANGAEASDDAGAEVAQDQAEGLETAPEDEATDGEEKPRRRRRSRRGGRGRSRGGNRTETDGATADADQAQVAADGEVPAEATSETQPEDGSESATTAPTEDAVAETAPVSSEEPIVTDEPAAASTEDGEKKAKPAPRKRAPRTRKPKAAATTAKAPRSRAKKKVEAPADDAGSEEKSTNTPDATATDEAPAAAAAPEPATAEAVADVTPEPTADDKPKRRGWWQRKKA
jgi:ribonuclease E